jgi:predicted permease
MGNVATVLPIFLGLAAGFVLRRVGLVDQRDGESLFKLVFYLFTPAVTFTALSTVDLQPGFAVYPAAAIVMIAVGYVASRTVAARAKLHPVQAAVMVSGSMVVNTSFQLPFVQFVYGSGGVARIAAFDVVNSVATFTVAYLAAARGNPAHGSRVPLRRLVTSPVLYAIAAGLLVNLTGTSVPTVVAAPVATVGAVTAVIIPIGIGILFHPLVQGFRPAALMIATRLVTGLLVAATFVLVLDLPPLDRTVVLLIGAAPLVFAGVTFASLENLDVRLATNALSLSLLLGVVISPVIILLSA